MQRSRRSQTVDHEAFAALFEQYKNLVYKTAYLMLGDAAEAEEAMQETFVRVYRSLPGFDPRKGALSTWLYRVSMNTCLNHRRRRRVPSQSLEGTPPALLGSAAAGQVDLADRDEVRRAIAKLTEDHRAVVILRYYFELSYLEIAEILDVPLGTVKSRLDRSLRMLRRVLAEQSEMPAAGLFSEEEAGS